MNQYLYTKKLLEQISELTPIEEHNGVYFKRDDLFIPFDGDDNSDKINGGKLRQCLSLFLENESDIRKHYNNTVSTATSVNSPQGVIISRAAKEFGFDSVIGIGNTIVEKAIEKHIPIRMSHELGSEIVLLCENQAFNNVLYSRLNRLANKRPMFIVMFGVNFKEHRNSVIDVIANQVQNIPDEIETVVVPLGSGISFASIISGILKYKKKIKRLIAVQPFGYDRGKTITSIVKEPRWEYRYEYYKGSYSYHKKLNINIGDIELDNIYESKAWDFIMKEKIVDKNKEKVLFWIVGNNNITRK